MTILNVVRDHLGQIRPLLYQFKGLDIYNNISFWCNFLRSFFSLLETRILSSLFYIFSFQWRKDFVHLLIFVPEIQVAHSNSGIFSTIPTFASDLFPKGINFPISIRIDSIFVSFQTGLFNAFSLSLPRSLSFLVTVRRYWLQGFAVGIRSTVGYRRGEVFLLRVVANGLRPFWWTTNSFFSLSLGIFTTRVILWESFSYPNNFFFFKKQERTPSPKNTIGSIKTVINSAFQNRYLFFVRFVHFYYSWIELGTFFRTLANQTFNIQKFSDNFLHLSYSSKIRYRRGLFLGGLFFDFLFRIIALVRLEKIFSRFRYPPTEWKLRFHKLTGYLIISFSFRRVPYYSADYLLFNSIGFFGRDTELRRRVSQSAFSYTIRPGMPLSILFEGRNVIGEDSYGRSTFDMIRKPLVISRLAVEAKRDLVDETYRTQQTNQRVDSVYLGTLERKIFDWLSIRNPKGSTIMDSQNKTAALLVKEPIRKDVGTNVTPRSNSLISKLPRVDFERSSDRFVRWFRAVRYIKAGEDKRFFGLPLGYAAKSPESLFALFTSDFSQQSYLASIGILEPQRVVRYSSSTEFTRKRNARRSPLHRGPVFRYIDLFVRTRSKIKGVHNDISTRQQQYDLYRARHLLHNYVASSRRYLRIERSFPKLSDELNQRVAWQSKFHFFLFGGNRSRSNSIYSQQYVGNLQLVRRLFSVSWDHNENVIPFQVQSKNKQLLRRKISLDQCTFDKQKTIFEHEELGKALPFLDRNRNEAQRLGRINSLCENRDKVIGSLIKKRFFPDVRIEATPLYLGWDSQKHAVVLANHFLPLEWATRMRLFNKVAFCLESNSKDFSSYYPSRDRKEFGFWPKNFRTRRIRLRGVRYNRRAFVQRRAPIGNERFLMSSDRRTWSRKRSSIFTFWFNPRSDLQREYARRPHNPVRGSQRFPLSLERGVFPETYIPGNLQPVVRGGFTWPGTDFSYFVHNEML
jgi:hypothetical protein